jgi:delta1-piperideine-2-carboxylate reductase
MVPETRQSEVKLTGEMNLFEHELQARVAGLLRRHGADEVAAEAVSKVVVAAERDGALAHGLRRLPAYVSALRTNWVNGCAEMTITDRAPGVVHVDAANGFAQAALCRAKGLAIEKARGNGICAISIHNSHHFAALWPDVEQFADAGLVCLAFVNCRSLIVAPGARNMVLGTNPVAFAVPRSNAPPLVCDQASSVMAHGDVQLAAQEGREVEVAVGVDRDGRATRDPRRIIDGGALLPFGGHKGFWIALMVEVLAAALTGSRFGFEDDLNRPDGGATSNAGQMLILIDPTQTGATNFGARFEALLEMITSAGTDRLPGDRRYHARAIAAKDGIKVQLEVLERLGIGS